jgi:hypothetical protein
MANQPSLDELRRQLEQRGLPPAYIERLVGELDDHYTDLLEERSSSMGAARKLDFEADALQERLGEPTQLAIFAAEQYRARSFWGRHPAVTFLLGPLPLLVACWIATMMGITGIGMGLNVCEQWFGMVKNTTDPLSHPFLVALIIAVIGWCAIAFPPLTVAALLCRVARRNAVRWRWPIAACAILALVAAFITVSYRFPIPPNNGQFIVGFYYDWTAKWFLLSYLPRFVAAIAIGLLLVKRSQQKLQLAT